MTDIPKEILDRLEFETPNIHNDHHNPRITKVQAIAPCESCGLEIDEVRRVRIQRNQEPKPHWREYCYTCKLVSPAGEDDWQPTQQLNFKMRQSGYWEDK